VAVAVAAAVVTVMREHVYSHLVMAAEMNQVSYRFVAVAAAAAAAVAVERVVTMETCYLVAPAVILLGVHLARLPTQAKQG
jgi:hypothetical protein